HLVVADFDLDARLFEREHDLLTDVDERVGRRNREVPFLVADRVPLVRAVLARVPVRLFGIDLVEGALLTRVETNLVEDEELGLGPEEDRVADARLTKIGFRFLRDEARIARVGLAGDGITDRADRADRGDGGEGVEFGRLGIWDDEHVRRVDRLPSANRRSVESEALFEARFREPVSGHGRVLPDTGEIDELQIEKLDVVLL